jgi:hypothetical protein
MKNKSYLFAVVLIVSMFFAGGCFASSKHNNSNNGNSYQGDGECSLSFWSRACQGFIHERDHIQNLRQIPFSQRYEQGYNQEGNRRNIVIKYPNLTYDYENYYGY